MELFAIVGIVFGSIFTITSLILIYFTLSIFKDKEYNRGKSDNTLGWRYFWIRFKHVWFSIFLFMSIWFAIGFFAIPILGM